MKNNIKKISLLLGIMCFLLTYGICMQIKTVNNSGTEVAKTNAENALRDSVLEMKEKYEKEHEKVEKKEEELSTLIDNASVNDSNSSELSEQLDKVNGIIGLTKLQGPGIVINMADGDAKNSYVASDYIVHDGDLLLIVNELANAGAEAISINGERIVSTSSISCIGSVIKINDEKVGTPFEIKAIGSKERLYGALTITGRYLDQIEKRGVEVEVSKSDSVIINKYNGIFNFEYAK